MGRQKKSSTPTLIGVLRRQSGRRTVLGVALPILAAQIDAMRAGQPFAGISAKQIEAGFRDLCSRFLHSQFHTTYIDRRLGPRGFLILENNRYRFRPTLFDGLSVDDLAALYEELVASLRDAAEQRRAAIRRLELACNLPDEQIAERHQLVKEYLAQFLGNGGENFEIVSFAILREYFRSFGFELQRFSTTHANDGGIDYVGGNAIYQVSTDESQAKLRSDLAKAPDVQRVLVRPKVTPELLSHVNEHVLETVELADLLAHFVGWLLSRDYRSKKARHLQGVLQVALAEFQREEKAEALGSNRNSA
jgi:hypothetical protein